VKSKHGDEHRDAPPVNDPLVFVAGAFGALKWPTPKSVSFTRSRDAWASAESETPVARAAQS
jgi:hypothetical protein